VNVQRLARAGVAIGLLAAFVTDLRPLVPAIGALLAVAGWRGALPRVEALGAAVLLAVATIAFGAGSEVQAWTLVLAVAVLAGVRTAIATGGPGRGRRVAGSSSRAG
jgi:hypothetical protein